MDAEIAGGFALFAAVALWQIFPFAFSEATIWPLVARTVLTVAIIGSAISMIVQLVALPRGAPITGSARW